MESSVDSIGYRQCPRLIPCFQRAVGLIPVAQIDMEEVGKLIEERTAYRIEGQIDLDAEVLRRRDDRQKAEDEEKVQEALRKGQAMLHTGGGGSVSSSTTRAGSKEQSRSTMSSNTGSTSRAAVRLEICAVCFYSICQMKWVWRLSRRT